MSLTYNDLSSVMEEIIMEVARENLDSDDERVLITPGKMQYYIEKQIGEAPSMPTLRKYGFGSNRKFELKFENASYNNFGNPEFRGLVIRPEELLEEVE